MVRREMKRLAVPGYRTYRSIVVPLEIKTKPLQNMINYLINFLLLTSPNFWDIL